MNPEIEKLDLVGEICPVPLLKTEKAVDSLPRNKRLEIVTDHTQAVRNIMEFLDDRSRKFELTELEPGIWQIEVASIDGRGEQNGRQQQS